MRQETNRLSNYLGFARTPWASVYSQSVKATTIEDNRIFSILPLFSFHNCPRPFLSVSKPTPQGFVRLIICPSEETDLQTSNRVSEIQDIHCYRDLRGMRSCVKDASSSGLL